MTDAFICDAARTPIGKFIGSLSHVRTDDLAAVPLKANVLEVPLEAGEGRLFLLNGRAQ